MFDPQKPLEPVEACEERGLRVSDTQDFHFLCSGIIFFFFIITFIFQGGIESENKMKLMKTTVDRSQLGVSQDPCVTSSKNSSR